MIKAPQKITLTLPWGPAAAIWVSIGAYVVSQLAIVVPVIFAGALSSDFDSTFEAPWFQLVLYGIGASALLLTLWLFLKSRKASFKDLGFKKIKASDFLYLLIAGVVYIFFAGIAFALAGLVPGFDIDQTQDIGFDAATGAQLGLAFIGLVILPPLAEEMLFRGFMYRGLIQKWRKIWAALLVSFLFGLVHFQWNVAIDTFVLSMVAIGLYEKTGNLWMCVFLHGIKNGVAFTSLFLLT